MVLKEKDTHETDVELITTTHEHDRVVKRSKINSGHTKKYF